MLIILKPDGANEGVVLNQRRIYYPKNRNQKKHKKGL